MKNSSALINTFRQIISKYFSGVEEDFLMEMHREEMEISEANRKTLDGNPLEDAKFKKLRRQQIYSLISAMDNKLSEIDFADLLLNLGKTSISLGELEIANDIYRLALQKFSAGNNVNLEANARLGLGEIHHRQAEWKEAARELNKAKKLFEKEKDNAGSVLCENLLGSGYGNQGNFIKAKKHFENCLNLLDRKKEKHLIAMVEGNLAIINQAMNKYDTALTFHNRALKNFEQLNDYKGMSLAHYNKGFLFMQERNFEESLKEFDLSISCSTKGEYLPALGISYLNKANIYAELKDFSLAIAFADKAMDISYELNDRLSVADVYKIKGVIQREMHNMELSENYLKTSLRLNEDLRNDFNYAETSYELGLLYKKWNRKDKSLEFLNKALSYKRKIKANVDMQNIEGAINGYN